INVARAGPGLGGIRPSQSDYFQATKALGHGDFYVIVLAPASVEECANLTITAFNLADKYRTPVMLLLDGMIGQMMEPVDFSLLPEVETYPKDWATNGHKNQRDKTVVTSIYLETQVLEKVVLERFDRYETMKQQEVRYEAHALEDAEIIITAFGATARIAKSAVDLLRSQGIKVGLFRPITLFPFPTKQIRAFPLSATDILCVEMNMGQMVEDVKLAVNGQREVHFYGRTGGEVPSVQEICEQVKTIKGD
ncbi:MAG: 3-methyl-2-oxobutanoate dehydrogenase subunit beta, partial [Oscillospiraceae bacterium]